MKTKLLKHIRREYSIVKIENLDWHNYKDLVTNELNIRYSEITRRDGNRVIKSTGYFLRIRFIFFKYTDVKAFLTYEEAYKALRLKIREDYNYLKRRREIKTQLWP